MSACCVTFPGPVSRATIYHIVIDYLKYILYYRGQFPLPLDQLKQILKQSSEFSTQTTGNPRVDGHPIHYDLSDQSSMFGRSNAVRNRNKQSFMDSISKFDNFFNELSEILETQNVIEIVLNVGANMMNPKEMYRIMLPAPCTAPECNIDYATLQRCKLQFFREIVHSELWTDLKTDTISPISVLLLLENGIALRENMEQKSFYSFPRHCRQRTLSFMKECHHIDKTSLNLQHFETLSVSNGAVPTYPTTRLWVRLKPDLKGFKSYSESSRSLSCSSLN